MCTVFCCQRLAGATLLVFANKQDLPGALSAQEIRQVSIFLSHLLIAGCDIGVNFLSVSSFVRPSTIHVQVLFSAAVIAGSMKTSIVIVLDILYKHIP